MTEFKNLNYIEKLQKDELEYDKKLSDEMHKTIENIDRSTVKEQKSIISDNQEYLQSINKLNSEFIKKVSKMEQNVINKIQQTVKEMSDRVQDIDNMRLKKDLSSHLSKKDDA